MTQLFETGDEFSVKPFVQLVSFSSPLSAWGGSIIQLVDSSGASVECNWVKVISLIHNTTDGEKFFLLNPEGTTSVRNPLLAGVRGVTAGRFLVGSNDATEAILELSDSERVSAISIHVPDTSSSAKFMVMYGYKLQTRNSQRGGINALRDPGA